jgi:hypothetical protein
MRPGRPLPQSHGPILPHKIVSRKTGNHWPPRFVPHEATLLWASLNWSATSSGHVPAWHSPDGPGQAWVTKLPDLLR